jgi:DNA-binding NtrC family response regulator
MGLILWIDENTFATSLLEKVFKSKNLPFYTLSDAKDFLYIVNDLRPDLLVLDALTIKATEETFLKQYENSEILASLPVVVIGSGEDLPFLKNKIGFIQRPFDPFEIPKILANFLEVH